MLSFRWPPTAHLEALTTRYQRGYRKHARERHASQQSRMTADEQLCGTISITNRTCTPKTTTTSAQARAAGYHTSTLFPTTLTSGFEPVEEGKSNP